MKVLAILAFIVSVLAFIGYTLFRHTPIIDSHPSAVINFKKQPTSKNLPTVRNAIRPEMHQKPIRNVIQPETQTQRLQHGSPDKIALLRTSLKDHSFDSYKVTVIKNLVKKNQESLLPNRLSLGDLNSILDSFDFDIYKLEVTKALRSRLLSKYSKSELDKYQNHYNFDTYKSQAIDLLR